MRLSTLIWITVAALLVAFFSQLFGWEAIRSGILIAWVAFLLVLAMTRGMRWTSSLTYLSVATLVGAVACQLAGSQSVRGWFLLAWAALLLPVAVGLFSHPMRGPAWGLFVGFWGVVGVLWLVVLQLIVVAGVLGGEAYRDWAAWPVGLVGLWFLVASSLGFGAERFPRGVDALGMVAGVGLLLISTATWSAASPEMVRTAGFFAAVMYGLYAISLGWVFWGTQDVTHRFRGLSVQQAVSS